MEHQPLPDEQIAASPTIETQLNASQQQALGCIACISDRGKEYVGEARRQVQSCTGSDRNKTNRAFAKLEQDGLVDSRPRTSPPKPGTVGPSYTEHSITKKGAALLSPNWSPCTREDVGNPTSNLTKIQLGYLRCITCLVGRGEEPRAEDIAYCNAKRPDNVRHMLKKLVAQGILEQSACTDTVRDRGGRSPVKYLPAPKTAPHMPAAKSILDCKQFNHKAETTFATLTDAQRRTLGCIACLTSKAKAGEITGAENLLIATCQDLPRDSVISNTARFCELDILESQKGYSRSGNRTIYIPTSLGRKMFRLTTLADTCTTDMAGANHDAIHLEKTVTKCLGCIWTKQIASEERPAVSTSMVVRCSGLSTKSVQAVIKKMVEAEEIRRTLLATDVLHNNNHPIPAYSPVAYLRPLPGTGGKHCKLPLYADVPTRYLQPLSAGDFDAPPKEELKNTYTSPWFLQAASHRLLDADEERALASIIQDGTDPVEVAHALESFLSHNFRLALWGTHREYSSMFLPFVDALQAAQQGVLTAAKRFNPDLARFSTYAPYWIRQSIQLEVARSTGAPIDNVYLFGKMYHAMVNFRDQFRRLPSVVELARDLQLRPRQADRALKRRQLAVDASRDLLDDYLNQTEQTATRKDMIGANDADLDSVELYLSFDRLRSYLSPLEKEVLENIVQDLGFSTNAIARKHSTTSASGAYARQRVVSLMRHPFFGTLAGIDNSLGWQEEATCNITGRDIVVTQTSGAVSSEAKDMCKSCPVNRQCENYARKAQPPLTTGIWNGRWASSYAKENSTA